MKPMVEILTEARELLADPDRWTRGTFARTKLGTRVSPHAASAESFCMLGAAKRVLWTDISGEGMMPPARENAQGDPLRYQRSNNERILDARLLEVHNQLQECLPNRSDTVADFNDSIASHDQVIGVYDCAIEKERNRDDDSA